ncbi:organic solute transporter Ostalpha-domain-containing protein [Macrophomina phaseolina]|uniref:Organic solute transporter Ostalpha-domain-containing protein n=1 Tax=Macrophomina phaseolina TaxID=35725 RepID=A0ABQ8GWC9_9PEZI|nr:organic solute transporter Ostalpha-domain-containing protein [Macrophomina phaseolina]
MTKCTVEDVEDIREEEIWRIDELDFGVTFHTVAQIIAFVFSAIAIIISLTLIFQHAVHYSRPYEQKQIIRILLMIPIYAAVSMLSIHYYHHHTYFEVLRDCYEAFAISSFFTLMCHYIAPSLHEQKEYFRHIETKNWVWPITWAQKCSGGETSGWLRKPRSGLTWFNIIWVSVFQYCFIRVFFTVVSVLAEKYNVLCEDSLSPVYAHFWSMFFESIAVTIAMYCLIQFYIQLKQDLSPHSPFLKVLCIKLVIFFCFWQSTAISFATSEGWLKESDWLAYADIKVGLPNLLICFEMAFFAIMHIFAFSWKPYIVKKGDPFADHLADGMGKKQKRYKGGFMGILAIVDAFNPWDIMKAFARGLRWLFVGVRQRHHDASYNTRVEGAGSPNSVEMATQNTAYGRARANSRFDAMDDEFDRRSSLDLNSDQESPFEHPDERRDSDTAYAREQEAARIRRTRSPTEAGYIKPTDEPADDAHLLSNQQPRPARFV